MEYNAERFSHRQTFDDVTEHRYSFSAALYQVTTALSVLRLFTSSNVGLRLGDFLNQVKELFIKLISKMGEKEARNKVL